MTMNKQRSRNMENISVCDITYGGSLYPHFYPITQKLLISAIYVIYKNVRLHATYPTMPKPGL